MMNRWKPAGSIVNRWPQAASITELRLRPRIRIDPLKRTSQLQYTGAGGAARWVGGECRPGVRPGHRTRAGKRTAGYRNAEPILLAPQGWLSIDSLRSRFFTGFRLRFGRGLLA